MKRTDVVKLVAYVTQLVPAQQFDEYTSDAWHDVLGDLPATLEQAREATAKVAKEQQWIYPSAIRSKLLGIMPPRQQSGPAAILAAPPAPRDERLEAARRGKAKCEEALAKANRFRMSREAVDIPENLKKARAMAAADRLGQAYRDRSLKLGAAGNEALTQISRNRKATT